MLRTGAVAVVLAVGALGAACSGDGKFSPPDRPPEPVPLVIWNSTQRPIEEIRVHDGEEYLDAANRLSAPLPDDGRTEVQFLAGQRVTVIRRNVDGGQRIAFSTAHGLEVRHPGYVLQVFQESFRLHAPDLADGPPAGEEQPEQAGDGDEAWADEDGGDP